MSKKAGTTSTQQSIDPATQAYIQKVMGAAQGAGASPGATNDQTQGQINFLQGMQPGANLGFSALAGNADATQSLMNPYQQQVIDANNKQWGQTNAQTQNALAARATQGGAFGGSRYGVAAGVAQGQNNLAQQGQTASLLQGGYTDAMNRASQLANFGFGASQGLQGLGDYQRQQAEANNPQARLLNFLRQGYMGPQGSTTTQSSSPSWMSSALGIAGLLGAPFSGGMSLGMNNLGAHG